MDAKRATIGFFVDWLDDAYQQRVMKGILSRAQERDVNVLIFEGGSIHSTRKSESNRNIIYEFAGRHNLDGVIVLTGAIGHFATRQQIVDFCTHYLPLPMVSISYQIDGIPSLFADNVEGMQQLVLHFIQVHGSRRIAYIGGPPNNQDALERYEAYVAALTASGIAVDTALVTRGDFTFNSGAFAARTLLLENDGGFDALIAANDDMALGAMQALREAGRKIPADIPVAGFDNNEMSTHSSPPLTTVSQSFDAQGAASVDLLLDRIAGKDVPEKTVLPSSLIVRESCGCFSQEVMNVGMTIPAAGKALLAADLAKDAVKLAIVILKKAGVPGVDAQITIHMESLIRGLGEYLDSKIANNRLLLLWNELESAVQWPDGYFLSAHKVVSELRRETDPYYSKAVEIQRKAENFFQQLRIIISEKANAEEKKSIQVLVQEFFVLHGLTEELLDIFEEEQVRQVLYDLIPQLKIPSTFISRFENGKKKCRLVFALKDWENIPITDYAAPFASEDLVPRGLFPDGRRWIFIIEALCHHDHIGMALFEMGPQKGRIYGELRRVISTRLQGATLFSQLRAQTNFLKAQSQTLSELRQVMGGMITTLSMTVEVRDPYTAGHQRRVADLARTIATEMDLPKDTIEGIRLASIVHDLGKIRVPAEILNKPGKLMSEEFNLIKVHSQVAYDILKTIDFPWPIADIVYQHHERLNGSGYPLGISGDALKLEARILGVADVVEAMASHRPYRPAVGVEQALEEIKKNRNVLYDADVVDACVALFEKKGYHFT
jgi:HD-GYP domain-containing protein (c-di-GMP phosphodiesterase class II)/DNA-binding LacI/PurR family transcriptional regulator